MKTEDLGGVDWWILVLTTEYSRGIWEREELFPFPSFRSVVVTGFEVISLRLRLKSQSKLPARILFYRGLRMY